MRTIKIIPFVDNIYTLENKLIQNGAQIIDDIDVNLGRKDILIIICDEKRSNILRMAENCEIYWHLDIDIDSLEYNLRNGGKEYVLLLYEGMDILEDYYSPEDETEVKKILEKIMNFLTIAAVN